MSEGTFSLEVVGQSDSYPYGLTSQTIRVNVDVEESAAIQCSRCGEHVRIIYYQPPKASDRKRIRLGNKCNCGPNVNPERLIAAYQGIYDQ